MACFETYLVFSLYPVGEMGGTVLSHPAQYLKIYNMIKQGWTNPAKLKVCRYGSDIQLVDIDMISDSTQGRQGML